MLQASRLPCNRATAHLPSYIEVHAYILGVRDAAPTSKATMRVFFAAETRSPTASIAQGSASQCLSKFIHIIDVPDIFDSL